MGRHREQVGPGRLADVAVNAFKSTLAASTAAFDQFQKATKQVVNFADASVRAAAATAKAGNGATAKARRAAKSSASCSVRPVTEPALREDSDRPGENRVAPSGLHLNREAPCINSSSY